jgi:hypothetical protein
MGFEPKVASGRERVDASIVPPGGFIAIPMNLTMVPPT